MKRISRFFLGLESIILAIVTLPWVAGMGMISMFAMQNAPVEILCVTVGTFLIALAGMICGWRLLVTFLVQGQVQARAINRWWWRIAAGALSLSFVAVVSARLVPDDKWPESLYPVEFMGFGLAFLPTFVHLCAEVWWRRIEPI